MKTQIINDLNDILIKIPPNAPMSKYNLYTHHYVSGMTWRILPYFDINGNPNHLFTAILYVEGVSYLSFKNKNISSSEFQHDVFTEVITMAENKVIVMPNTHILGEIASISKAEIKDYNHYACLSYMTKYEEMIEDSRMNTSNLYDILYRSLSRYIDSLF